MAERVALITGGSFGLGLALAREALSRGWAVIACGRSEARLAAARGALPALETVPADITRPGDRARLFERALQGGRAIDCLVNNAAVSHAHDYANPFTLAADRAREEIETNFAAPIELTRLFLAARGESERPATIVNVSTPGALFALEANPLYAATKAGFHMFTLVLRRQLRASGVRVLEVFPPALDTGLARELEVEGQAANGARVIAEVARRSWDGIEAGEETILPHRQSEALIRAIRVDADAVADNASRTVRRRAGWDRDEGRR